MRGIGLPWPDRQGCREEAGDNCRAADWRLDAGPGRPFRPVKGGVRGAAVRVADQSVALNRLGLMRCLFERVEPKGGSRPGSRIWCRRVHSAPAGAPMRSRASPGRESAAENCSFKRSRSQSGGRVRAESRRARPRAGQSQSNFARKSCRTCFSARMMSACALAFNRLTGTATAIAAIGRLAALTSAIATEPTPSSLSSRLVA